MEALPAGSYLAQYTGEVLAKEELETRMANMYQMGQTLYILPLGQTAMVDATKKGSIARLGVHSCDPTAEVKSWLVEVYINTAAEGSVSFHRVNLAASQIGGVEQQVLAMYSLKTLSAGDPITYDFSPQLELLKTTKVLKSGRGAWKEFPPYLSLQPCTCGTANCKRILGSSVRTVGPRQCTACQAPLIQARKST